MCHESQKRSWKGAKKKKSEDTGRVKCPSVADLTNKNFLPQNLKFCLKGKRKYIFHKLGVHSEDTNLLFYDMLKTKISLKIAQDKVYPKAGW